MNLHNSRSSTTFLPCGHAIHIACYNEMIQTSISCPLCRKSVCDPALFHDWYEHEIAMHVMPEEYANKTMIV